MNKNDQTPDEVVKALAGCHIVNDVSQCNPEHAVGDETVTVIKDVPKIPLWHCQSKDNSLTTQTRSCGVLWL